MSFTKLFHPKHNPFGIYIYNPKDNSLNFKAFSQERISSSKLSNYKGKGAYCNSYSYLLISESNNFWIINHSSFQIRYKRMPIVKNNHSIIFIPSSNPTQEEGKIFIVGGDDKKSFYYDLKKNYFINWAQTNEIHCKPALIKIGDYLYLFDSLQQKNFCFERTNLSDNNHKWEKIIPQVDQNIIKNFPSQTLAVALDINNNIVFLGGDNIDITSNNSYIYNINKNSIYLSDKGTNDNMNFIDKTFYDIDNKCCLALPEDLNEIKEIALIDKNEQSLIKYNIVDENSLLISNSTVSQELKNEPKQNNINNDYKNNLNISNQFKLEPKEFGYYISSISSQESKIKAKQDKIKIIEYNQEKTINYEMPKVEAEKKEVNIKEEKEENIENKNIEEIQEKEEEIQKIDEKQKEEKIEINQEIKIEETEPKIEEEKIEEAPKYEEINTDIGKNENEIIQENNNIYIKDSLVDNKEGEAEENYEIVDEQEEEELDNQNKPEQVEEQNARENQEQEENAVNEEINQEEEYEEDKNELEREEEEPKDVIR